MKNGTLFFPIPLSRLARPRFKLVGRWNTNCCSTCFYRIADSFAHFWHVHSSIVVHDHRGLAVSGMSLTFGRVFYQINLEFLLGVFVILTTINGDRRICFSVAAILALVGGYVLFNQM